MAKYELTYRWSLRVNTPPASFRDRMGDWLRRLATRIDRRFSAAIRIDSTPGLTRADQVACVNHGLKATEWAIAESVRLQACEALMLAHPSVEWGTDGR